MLPRPVLAVVLACLALAGPVLAQVPEAPLPAAQAEPAAEPPAVTEAAAPGAILPRSEPSDLQALIATLENDQARAELLAKLRALNQTATAGPETDYLSGALDSLDAAVSGRMEVLGEALAGVVGSLQQVPVLLDWARSQLTEPISRSMWYTIGSQVGGAVLAGFAASLVVRLLLRRWRDRRGGLPLEATRHARLRASLAHLAVNLAALLTFLVVTHFVLSYTAISILGRRVAGDILVSIACVRMVTALSKAYLAPENARRRLSAMNDAEATEAERWMVTLFGLGLYGHFGLTAARRLGLPWSVHGFLSHLLFFIVAVLTMRAIYRLRAYLGAAIERWGEASGRGLARYLPWHAFSAAGHHMLAAWVALVYLAWAVGSPDAAILLTRGLLVAVLVLIAVRAVNVWLDWTVVRRASPGAAEDGGPEPEPPPTIQVVAITALRVGVMISGLLVIAQAWGMDVLGWVTADTGRAALATIGRIGLILAVVIAAGQLLQRGAGRYIAAKDVNGNPLYSNRTRTLVSMARNLAVTMLVAIGIVEVLSELGVNANALLAGAGVVGLAIGFGAQTLVKDLITGLFILVGDTVRVGDVVDLGGKAGVVEAISMRTITLRAYNGDVHTIPFSSIDVVTNMTKDFSYYVFDVVVAYKEDVDRVIEVLREIDSHLRREWPYRRLMLEPLEIAGVDAFRESGVLIKARTRVRPGEQWKVGREFNRRIKRRFDELGIELPVPQQKVHWAIPPTEAQAAPAIHQEPMRRTAGEA